MTKAIIELIIERLKKIPNSKLIVATTKNVNDDKICKICKKK